jgi:hypothetical protein
VSPLEEHRRLRALLDSLDDAELQSLVEPGRPSQGSWGWSGAAQVDGTPVFVKQVPVTEVEAAAWPSTGNHFGLPVQFHYGVGSAGFGAAREAAAHAQATAWAAEGALDGVALLHHARLLPRCGEPWALPLDRATYLAGWGDDPAVAAYVDAREGASHELWLVEEHLPHTLGPWLVDHQDRVDDVLEKLLGTARGLAQRDVVHFDAHFQNVLVDDDGERLGLADFGLALSGAADLAADERELLAAHRHYDLGEIIFSLTGVLGTLHRSLAEEERERARQAAEVAGPDQGFLLLGLVAAADRLVSEGIMDLHPRYVAALERYRPVIDLVGALLWGLVRDPSKRLRHDDAALVARLRDCGVDLVT